jgi:hypothetical protein
VGDQRAHVDPSSLRGSKRLDQILEIETEDQQVNRLVRALDGVQQRREAASGCTSSFMSGSPSASPLLC